ncbi:MAG TPA: DUF454 domain-containing protein [Campylobacterales bacterium]|nr:DUF454 domain-containing protein [Campylobacterales bacterium]
MKYIYLLLGFLMLGSAILGVILPLLPTVPFLLLAAFFFAKSSQRLHTWLLNHKIFGTMIDDWNSRGAINKKAKYMSTLSVLLVIGVSLVLALKPLILFIQIGLLSLVMLFIWTRPNS